METHYKVTFINKCKSSLTNLLASTNSYLLEIQNSTLSIVVGIWFIIYPYDYNMGPGTFQYLDIISPYIWGIIYAFFGILHLLCLFTGLRRIRKQVMLVKSSLWAFLTITILLANPYSLVAYLTAVFMIMTFITFLKVQILSTLKNKDGLSIT